MDARQLLENRYSRFTLTPGLVAWVYEYRNRAPITRRGAIATGLELGVQLCGDWLHRGSRAGERLFGPGARAIHTISPSERYDIAFTAPPDRPGLQVGFILYPGDCPDFAALPGELRFTPGASEGDARFVAFCRSLYQKAGATVSPGLAADGYAEVRRFVERSCELVPRDPLLAARQAIEKNLAQPLYLHHLAEVARMHKTTFARRFARTFGMTPIRYRLMLRLNEAARLTWARADLPLTDIAAAVGFEDLVYFHRAFKTCFGLTPAQYGRRESALLRTLARPCEAA